MKLINKSRLSSSSFDINKMKKKSFIRKIIDKTHSLLSCERRRSQNSITVEVI
jgi:hypothetical protein